MATFTEHMRRERARWFSRTPAHDSHPLYSRLDKLSARQIAAEAGVPAPAILAGPCDLEDLDPPDRPCVVKPIHGSGSRAVYVLTPNRDTWDELRTGRTLTWDEIRTEAATALDAPSNRRQGRQRLICHASGPWIVEEPVLHDGHIAYEYKAFTIGGRVRATVQILRAEGTVYTKWYDPQWQPAGVILPSPKHTPDQTMPPPIDGPALTAAAEAVAAVCGATFVRVDLFEHPQDGPVFGEATPLPGHIGFVPEWDRKLGQAWDEAEAAAAVTATP